ncbi:MAG: hypothetical protein IT360_01035 [Gemmatimonadaceae bacterium]|nr:hypothetical protein [Gemmatimonadaceae bacterium]
MSEFLGIIVANVATLAVVSWLMGLWLKARLKESIRHEYALSLAAIQASLGMQQEVAKKRMAAISDVWGAISSYDRAYNEALAAFASTGLNELRSAGNADIPEVLPYGLDDLITLALKYDDANFEDESIERIDSQQRTSAEAVDRASAQVSERIFENRFWLGRELESELYDFANKIGSVYSEIIDAPHSATDTMKRLQALREQRPDAVSVLERIWTAKLSNKNVDVAK